MINAAKDAVLLVGAVGGLMAGLYSQMVKPAVDETRLKALETQMTTISPKVESGIVTSAVLGSRLDTLEKQQTQILNIVLDIKRKI